MNILVLDDEAEIADLVELFLKNEGYNVYKFYSSSEAIKCINSTPLDLALLDVMLTAKVEDNDKIIGLSLGADDYITKPFNPLEMVSRVKAQLRRYTLYNGTEILENKEIFDSAGLIVNHQTHVCTLYEKEIALTPTEFNILWLLCKNAGKVVSTEEIFEKIWNEKYLDSNNTVMVHIRHLREKMSGPAGKSNFIKTVWGVGYRVEK